MRNNNHGFLMNGSMMIALLLSAVAITGRVTFAEAAATGDCPTVWKCYPMMNSTSIAIDGDLSDWTTVEGISTPLMSILGTEYRNNALATYKCLYDTSRIYFAFDIPGIYKFNSTDNTQCAAIATMTKIGVDATFVNMGGCPDQCGANGTIPSTCDSFRVDIGAHWKLKTTQQGVAYNLEGTVTTTDDGGAASSNVTKSEFPLPLTGTGDDALANNDDEYAVNAFCRFDDNDSLASNEWGGAWMFTTTSGEDAQDGDEGSYQFELVRSLRTASDKTDAQMTPGNVYEFGIAFWDPNETSDGWTDAGHYVTGCALKWIDLELVANADEQSMNAAGSTSSDAFSVTATSTSTLVTVAGSILMGFLGFVMM